MADSPFVAARGSSFGTTPRRPIKVCHPVWRLGRGGLERQLLALISKMPPDQVEHMLIVRGAIASELEGLDFSGRRVELLADQTSGPDPWWAFRLAGEFRRRELDLIHVRGLSLLPDVVLAARLAGNMPVGFSFHGFEAGREAFGVVRRRIYRWALGRCRSRWAVSPAAAAALTRSLGLEDPGWEILSNGVDIEHYRPAGDTVLAKRALGLPPQATVFLCVANLKPIKGHSVLLDAFARLSDATMSDATMSDVGCRMSDVKRDAPTSDIGGGPHDPISHPKSHIPHPTSDLRHPTSHIPHPTSHIRPPCLVLVGRDYMDGQLQRRVAESGKRLDVRFVGEQADVLPWYHAADVFVLPSRFEGLSNALLEAMSCGLPIVSTSAGGSADLIQHGENGLLTPAGDPDALGGAMRFLSEDPMLRGRLSRAARRTVCERFSLESAAETYLHHYAAAAGGSFR